MLFGGRSVSLTQDANPVSISSCSCVTSITHVPLLASISHAGACPHPPVPGDPPLSLDVLVGRTRDIPWAEVAVGVGGGGMCAGLASWGLSAGDWAVTCPCPGSRYKKRGRPLWAWKWAEKYGCQSGGLGPTIPHASSLYPSSWNRLPLLGFSREPTPCLLA